ncbi:MAG: N-acetylglucosamine-6-phosphate deacetylase [Cryptosporangiaceae bacterium]|jgi:N-acetylglucosamine-6-phosphate deacetylase|nr:N-acetylglucosamine-6-phosphate deacetylase [Cryptosporangiaceae bacterium]
MSVLHSARLVLPSGVVEGGWITVSEGRIVAVGGPQDPRPSSSDGHDELDLGGRWLLPGFVDLHVHGGGGKSLTIGDADEALGALALHRTHGTTTSLASLLTNPIDDIVRGAEVLADLADDGHIAGIHLEGPFLSHIRCGAQDPAYLLAPDPAALDAMLTAGRGHVRVVTIAPELPGAIDLIKRIVDAGAVAAIGHTDATYDQTCEGLEAGARLATHLFNGMRGVHHREPGPATALLEHPEVVVEIVADGVHLHDAITRLVFDHCGPNRVAMITDAMAAAGAADGIYPLGPQMVHVQNGIALLEGTHAIAGSTLTMDSALRRVVNSGVPIQDVSAALSTTPARVVGLDKEIGSIAEGLTANLLVLDADLAVDAIMIDGEWTRKPV